MENNITTVVNIYKSSYDIYCGRAGKGKDGYFGNPFKCNSYEPKGATIGNFKTYFYSRLEKDSEFKEKVHALKGKILGCFCKPNPCHADIIAEYLNNIKDE